MYALKRTNTFHHCLEHFASRARANELLTIPRTDGYKRTCMYVCMYVCMYECNPAHVCTLCNARYLVCMWGAPCVWARDSSSSWRDSNWPPRKAARRPAPGNAPHLLSRPHTHTYIYTYIHIYTLERERAYESKLRYKHTVHRNEWISKLLIMIIPSFTYTMHTYIHIHTYIHSHTYIHTMLWRIRQRCNDLVQWKSAAKVSVERDGHTYAERSTPTLIHTYIHTHIHLTKNSLKVNIFLTTGHTQIENI